MITHGDPIVPSLRRRLLENSCPVVEEIRQGAIRALPRFAHTRLHQRHQHRAERKLAAFGLAGETAKMAAGRVDVPPRRRLMKGSIPAGAKLPSRDCDGYGYLSVSIGRGQDVEFVDIKDLKCVVVFV